eukprot:1985162-Prymnesium_polylepis.1
MDDAQDERKALECLLESSASSVLMSVSNMPTMLRFEYKLLNVGGPDHKGQAQKPCGLYNLLPWRHVDGARRLRRAR